MLQTTFQPPPFTEQNNSMVQCHLKEQGLPSGGQTCQNMATMAPSSGQSCIVHIPTDLGYSNWQYTTTTTHPLWQNTQRDINSNTIPESDNTNVTKLSCQRRCGKWTSMKTGVTSKLAGQCRRVSLARSTDWLLRTSGTRRHAHSFGAPSRQWGSAGWESAWRPCQNSHPFSDPSVCHGAREKQNFSDMSPTLGTHTVPHGIGLFTPNLFAPSLFTLCYWPCGSWSLIYPS